MFVAGVSWTLMEKVCIHHQKGFFCLDETRAKEGVEEEVFWTGSLNENSEQIGMKQKNETSFLQLYSLNPIDKNDEAFFMSR